MLAIAIETLHDVIAAAEAAARFAFLDAADFMKERAGSLLDPGHVYVSFPAGRSSGKSCHGSIMPGRAASASARRLYYQL